VQFNNHAGSTKSFDYVREHNEAVNRLDLISPRDPIHVNYAPGETVTVAQHDGSILSLHKLAELYNPNNRAQALGYLQARQARGQVVTGLLYIDPKAGDLHDSLETVDTPLNQLGEAELVPGAAALEKLNASLR
jgi:2-oxoglutarate ferredoxin oxidoreductase subunit beta